jgi:hypothetical protein
MVEAAGVEPIRHIDSVQLTDFAIRQNRSNRTNCEMGTQKPHKPTGDSSEYFYKIRGILLVEFFARWRLKSGAGSRNLGAHAVNEAGGVDYINPD